MTAIETQNLCIGYSKKAGALYSNINAKARRGRLIALLGANGIGKSTLMRSLCRLQSPLSGRVLLSGGNESAKMIDTETLKPAALARLVSYVPARLLRSEHLSVYDMVSMGRYSFSNWLGNSGPQGKARVMEALRKTGMENLSGRDSFCLSDGEYHRAALARALVQECPLMLLDEPMAFLDIPGKYSISQLLRQLAVDEGRCIIFSTHDPHLALQFCNELWLMGPRGFSCASSADYTSESLVSELFGI